MITNRRPNVATLNSVAGGRERVLREPGAAVVDSFEVPAGIMPPEEFPEFVSRGPEDPRTVRVG